MAESLIHFSKKANSLLPSTYYEELAEMGSLHEFLTTFMSEEFHANPEFRREMLYIMLDHCEGNEREVEHELLGDLHRVLKNFLDKHLRL